MCLICLINLFNLNLLDSYKIPLPPNTHTYIISQRTEDYQNSLGNTDLSVKVTFLHFIAAEMSS